MPAQEPIREFKPAPGGVRADPKTLGRQGAFTSWSRTTDRRARMRPAQAQSPTGDAWHARRLGFDPERLTESQMLQVKAARAAWYAGLTAQSAKARRRRKAKRLRTELAEIEAENDGAA